MMANLLRKSQRECSNISGIEMFAIEVTRSLNSTRKRNIGNKLYSEILYDNKGGYNWGWEAHGDPRSEKYFKL
jgi:hypothetical protein